MNGLWCSFLFVLLSLRIWDLTYLSKIYSKGIWQHRSSNEYRQEELLISWLYVNTVEALEFGGNCASSSKPSECIFALFTRG